MRILKIIFILFVLPIPIYSQNIDTVHFSNRLGINIDAVSGSLYYTTSISKKWFIGGGIGLGGNLNHTLIEPENYSTTLIKLIHVDIITNYEVNNNFNIDVGLNGSYSQYGEKNPDDELGYQGLYSGFVTFLYGWKHFKFGTQLSISGLKPKYNGIVKPMTVLIYSTPLILNYRFIY